jgi:cysteinyl-tRNA synthetase
LLKPVEAVMTVVDGDERTTPSGREGQPRVLALGGRRLPVIGTARVYVCGVTPYDVTHLGHAATYVWADTAVRVLRRVGGRAEVCRNVTDVDDVLLEAASRAGRPYDEFAAVQQFQFDQDMAALGVRRPKHEPRAHTHVGPVVQLAAALIDAGTTYARDGTVYFRGAEVAERAGLDRETALALAAEYGDHPEDPAKDDPLDVAVWRASTGQAPAWPSPWGPGRPGWHAECAAMALATFGPGIDLLAGGADLHFPHHAFQQAQAEAATGVRPFSRTHMPVGIVQVQGRKMAKSAGNLVLVRDLLARHPAPVVRMLVLDRRWDAVWDYAEDSLDAAAQRLESLYSAGGRPSHGNASAAVLDRLCDDLDVPTAIDTAVAEGGPAARLLLTLLGLA